MCLSTKVKIAVQQSCVFLQLHSQNISFQKMSEFDLLHLPDIVLEKVLLHFSYDEIARFRIICKRFDSLCKKLLNKGYIAAEKFNSQSIKAVKLQLPRRESERQLHPMARNLDILCAIETRISMLSMTFMKYVDNGLCCFIPGKVIDEIFRVLKYGKNCRNPSQSHDVLKELRDISSMAMDYFNEKIAPDLKKSCSGDTYAPSPYASLCSVSNLPSAYSNSTQSYFTDDKLRLEFQRIKRSDKKTKMELQSLKNKVRQHKSRLIVQRQQLTLQADHIAEHDAQITEMKCTLKEWDQKFGDLIARLSCVSDQNAVLTAASKSSQVFLVQPCTSNNFEGGKRKFESKLVETPGNSKKSKLDDNFCVKDYNETCERVSSE